MTASTATRLARRLAGGLLATALGLGATVATSGAAHADIISDIVGGTTVGGTVPSYSTVTEFRAQTICSAWDRKVTTRVVGSPRPGTYGEYFSSRIWYRDLSSSTWYNTGWSQWVWAPTQYLYSYSMTAPVSINSSYFYGVRGHSYQVIVEAAHSDGYRMWSLGSEYAGHFSNNSYAPATTVYGQVIASLPGTAATSCFMY
jgi:hypothetical protein